MVNRGNKRIEKKNKMLHWHKFKKKIEQKSKCDKEMSHIHSFFAHMHFVLKVISDRMESQFLLVDSKDMTESEANWNSVNASPTHRF